MDGESNRGADRVAGETLPLLIHVCVSYDKDERCRFHEGTRMRMLEEDFDRLLRLALIEAVREDWADVLAEAEKEAKETE